MGQPAWPGTHADAQQVGRFTADQHNTVYCTQVVGLGLDDPQCAVTHAPLTVLPTPFPADSFAKAKRAMTVFNYVMDRVSRDTDYLQQTLKGAAAHDDFTVCPSCQRCTPLFSAPHSLI